MFFEISRCKAITMIDTNNKLQWLYIMKTDDFYNVIFLIIDEYYMQFYKL